MRNKVSNTRDKVEIVRYKVTLWDKVPIYGYSCQNIHLWLEKKLLIDAHYRLIVLACQKTFFLRIKLNNESLSSRCCVKGETIFKNPSLQDVSFWILWHTNHDFHTWNQTRSCKKCTWSVTSASGLEADMRTEWFTFGTTVF